MKIMSLFFKKALTLEEKFKNLVKDFNLCGQADLSIREYPGAIPFILIRIARNEEEKNVPLPSDFVEAVKSLLSRHHGNKINLSRREIFQIKTMTLEEIQKDQRSWSAHCEMFWASC